MLVALAVTVVALGVVTVVFDVTTRTATQAAAVAELESRLRNFMLELERDLDGCDPARSVLVLAGRTQAAALTEDDLEAGRFYRVLVGDPEDVPDNYRPEFDPDLDPGGADGIPEYSNPRADVLMFFTQRQLAAQAPPSAPGDAFGQALLDGARYAPVQVVYGHAAFDDVTGGPGSYAFAGNERHIETTVGGRLSPIPASRWHLARRATIIQVVDVPPAEEPGEVSFTGPERERITRCYSGDDHLAGDAASLDLEALFGPRWLSDAGLVDVAGGPYVIYYGGARRLVDGLLYRNAMDRNHHVATVLEAPPAELRSNLGLHMLPGCVWFQVEFLMPEDPRNGPDSPLAGQRNDMPRWVAVRDGQTYVFVPDTQANRELVAGGSARQADFALLDPGRPAKGDNRRIRMWPYALRVTVRVIDRDARLGAPLVRSLVHRFE